MLATNAEFALLKAAYSRLNNVRTRRYDCASFVEIAVIGQKQSCGCAPLYTEENSAHLTMPRDECCQSGGFPMTANTFALWAVDGTRTGQPKESFEAQQLRGARKTRGVISRLQWFRYAGSKRNDLCPSFRCDATTRSYLHRLRGNPRRRYWRSTVRK